MIDHLVFWGLCALLIFLPLPIGSVEEWAVFVFEAGTIGLFLLYVGGRLFGRRRMWPRGSISEDNGYGQPFTSVGRVGESGPDGRLPLFFKIPIGIFLGLSLIQVVPLPASLVKVLSPRAYAIYAGLVRDAILAPSSTLTLSLSPGATRL